MSEIPFYLLVGWALSGSTMQEKETSMSAPMIVTRWSAWAPQLLSVLRIVAAFVFIQFGTMKIFGFPIAMPEGGTASLTSQVGIGGLLEVVGGALLLVGLFTRPVAFILAGEMAVAYFQFHAPQSFWPIVNQGHPAILYCFIWLYLSAAGPGPWSLDALRKK
jgi:putative oxidoreductase